MKHVLVAQLARFGDLVQTKRLLLSVAAEADTQAHLCVDASLAALAALLYPFAVIHSLPAHTGTPGTRNPAQALVLAGEVFSRLREQRFSTVYMVNNSPLSTAFAALFPPECVRGYAVENGQPLRDYWCRLATRWTGDRAASPLNLVDFWAYLHPDPVRPETVNPIPHGAGAGRIGVVMAGRQARRSLPSPVLGACLQAVFQARGGPALVCLGGKTERPLVRRLARHLSHQAVEKLEDTTGATHLSDLPDLLRGLDLLITPDTGLMHLAAHLGVPVQAFFLSSAWCFETGPYGMGHTVWQATLPCSPCLENAQCRHAVACLEPFSHPDFLAHLSGRPATLWPDGLTGYVSAFDELGVTYRAVDGNDAALKRRAALRKTLAEYLGAPALRVPGRGVPDFAPRHLFHDADWMLPQRGARKTS